MAARSLRWGCHGIAAVWLALLFVTAQADGSPAPVSPPEPTLARLRPLPETPVAVEPPVAPDAPPAPPPETPAQPPPPLPEPPDRALAGDLERGGALLGAGAFPVLSCGYASFPSFLAYARAMESLGARFVVVRRREIVGAVDLATGAISSASLTGSFSPRARDYTDEPGLAAMARSARERFGAGAVVMMLVPRAIDAGLFGGIARLLAERAQPHDGFREILASYERAGDGVRLRVDAGIRPDGTRVDLGFVFDLATLRRASGGSV